MTAVPLDDGIIGRESVGLHGRNRVTARAMQRVTSAVTADVMGVAARTVSVALSDHEGKLEVTASTPITVIALGGGRRVPRGGTPAGGASIIDRATAAQSTIQQKLTELTGSTISAVNLRLTNTHIEEEGRVT